MCSSRWLPTSESSSHVRFWVRVIVELNPHPSAPRLGHGSSRPGAGRSDRHRRDGRRRVRCSARLGGPRRPSRPLIIPARFSPWHETKDEQHGSDPERESCPGQANCIDRAHVRNRPRQAGDIDDD